MSRNGSGVYSLPAGYEAVTGETILATQHNTPLEDLAADLNVARPIVAGGTGATTAVAAADNLSTKSSAIASAATTDLSTASGVFAHITGTTTITAFGTVASGARRVLVFDGALTLTHNATSLILPGAANITTAAGDIAVMVSEGSGNWRCASYQRYSGLPVIGIEATTNANISGSPTASLSIPSWAKVIKLTHYNVLPSSAALVRWRLGDSGGVETTGYLGNVDINGTRSAFTTGFELCGSTSTAVYGTLTLVQVDALTWMAEGQTVVGTACIYTTGHKVTSAALTTVEISNGAGANFTSGAITATYW